MDCRLCLTLLVFNILLLPVWQCSIIYCFLSGSPERSRTCRDRWMCLTGRWGTLQSTTTSGTREPILWNRTARTQSSGEPSARTTDKTIQFLVLQRAFARWGYSSCSSHERVRITAFQNPEDKYYFRHTLKSLCHNQLRPGHTSYQIRIFVSLHLSVDLYPTL